MEFKVLSVYIIVSFICVTAQREKRTIDLVLRSVADVFGYDVQKRPTALPPPPPPAPKSTFFPPPVAPLPAAPPRASAAPPKPQLPATPPVKPTPTKNTIPQPPKKPIRPPPPTKVTLPLPRSPPKPPTPSKTPPAPPPPPPAPSKAPPQKPAPAPVLTESVRKTFNINFNWDRRRQPATTAAAPPKKQPPPSPSAPPSVPTTSQKQPPVAPPTPSPKPSQAAPLPPAPTTRLPTPSHRKPQLYEDYDRVNSKQGYGNDDYGDSPDYAHTLPYKNSQDYESAPDYDYKTQQVNNDYQAHPESNAVSNYEDSRDRFKDSIKTFWENSPWITNQHGLKFIIAPEDHAENDHLNDYPEDISKYEEYEINEERPPKHYANEVQHEDNDVKHAEVYDEKHSDEDSYDDTHSSKKEYLKTVKYKNHESDKESPENLVEQGSKNEEIVEPLHSGVLPKQLHELYQKDKNVPWPAPFDIHYSASEKKNNIHQYEDDQEVDEDKEKVPFLIRTYREAKYIPEKYTDDFTYEIPEPSTENYEKLSKITYEDDEDEKDLSKNAKVHVKQRGKKITLLSRNKDTKAI